jgi:hypothetical protein
MLLFQACSKLGNFEIDVFEKIFIIYLSYDQDKMS